MIIFRPQLPPKEGYVEVEIDGQRLYKNVETGFILGDNQEQILGLKKKLTSTDYVVIKIAEGVATAEQYADVLTQRTEWRAQITELGG